MERGGWLSCGAPEVRRRAGSFLWTAGRLLSTVGSRLAGQAVGIGCIVLEGGEGGPVGCRSWLLGWIPQQGEGEEGSMEDERRPRASAWQIAGVWIAAAALLLTAARMGLDLWQMSGR